MKKLIILLNIAPSTLKGVINVNDRHRLYDIIIAVHKKKESIDDTKEELRNAITSSGEFYHPEKVIADCMNALDTIPMFLDYLIIH